MFGKDADSAIADARYGFISWLARECVKNGGQVKGSDTFDNMVTHKILGIPALLLVLLVMFNLTFTLGEPFIELLDKVFAVLGEKAGSALILPLMSCSARLPIYVLFISAFFPRLSSALVMELPSYRIPTISGALIHALERARHFLRKAGLIILSAVIIIWLLGSLPFGVEYASQGSLVGLIGNHLSPIFKPLGFGFWQAAVALIFGLIAKEVIIRTFGTLYGVEQGALAKTISQHFTPLSAYAFMVFVLLYIPCVDTIAIIKQETSWRWALLAVSYTVALAWAASFIVYRAGLMAGIG